MDFITVGDCKFENPVSIPEQRWVDDMHSWPSIEQIHVMHYLLHSKACDLRDVLAYKSLDSFNYLKSGWVGQILYCKLQDNIVALKCEVTRSQAINECPHLTWVICKNEGEVLIGGCSCMAGLGKVCSHVGALLWKVESANRNNLVGLSCTDGDANWNKGTKQNITPAPMADIQVECKRKNNQKHKVWKPNQYYEHQAMVNALKESPLAPLLALKSTLLCHTVTLSPLADLNSYTSKTTNLLPDPVNQVLSTLHTHQDLESLPISCGRCNKFYTKFVVLDDEIVDELQKLTLKQAKSELWQSSRVIRITASTASKVPKNATTKPDVYLKNQIHKPFKGNFHTKRGSAMEPLAHQKFISKTGLSVVNSGTFVWKFGNWLSSSPDGLIGEDTILEIKCPANFELPKLNIDVSSFKPVLKDGGRGYYMQVQLTMLCTGRKMCKFYVWTVDEDLVIDVPFDEEFIGKHINRLKCFYFSHVLPELSDLESEGCLKLHKTYRDLVEK